jgi:hypothetical protein
MSEEIVRLVGLVACTATLSLFSTVVAFAAVNVASLRWDGTFCTAQLCKPVLIAEQQMKRSVQRAQRPRLASLPARAL